MSRADDLVRLLHPRVLIQRTEEPFDTALGMFTLKSSTVKSYHEFEGMLIAYMDHVEQRMGNASYPPHRLIDKARRFLTALLGSYEEAVFLAMSGAKGGCMYVLSVINEGYKQEEKAALVEYVINTYIDPLDFDQAVEVMEGLRGKLAAYCPQPFAFIKPETMAANYKDVIKQYVESVSQYKNLWQYP